jgi:DNA-binding NtrC family response regulator
MTRVLVVDDEPDYPQLLSIILSKEGFEVQTAASSEEARCVAKEFTPDVLIVDWMLDGAKDGLQVSQTLGELNPGMRTVLITGYPSDAVEAHAEQVATAHFLNKPFTPSQLVELVRRVVDAA